MMERSSTFISLSGLSGVGAGLAALTGCVAAFYILNHHQIDYFDGQTISFSKLVIMQLGLVALATLISAVAAAIYFTVRKSKQRGYPLWTVSTRNILQAALIPLMAGGVFCLIMVWHHFFFLVAPCMLVFYGLALVSASKYTHADIFWLGLLELLLGLLATIFVGYGLVFWGVGFGFLHIFYGVLLYKKYN